MTNQLNKLADSFENILPSNNVQKIVKLPSVVTRRIITTGKLKRLMSLQNFLLLQVCFFLTFCVSGCSLFLSPTAEAIYLLEYESLDRNSQQASSNKESSIENPTETLPSIYLKDITDNPNYLGNSILFKHDEGRLGSYQNSHWAETFSQAFLKYLSEDINQSGYFKAVGYGVTQLNYQNRFQVKIEKFYQDISQDSCKLVAEVRVEKIPNGTNSVNTEKVFSKVFSKQNTCEKKDALSAVRAYRNTITALSKEITQEIVSLLKN